MFLVLELEISSNTKRYWAFSRTLPSIQTPYPSYSSDLALVSSPSRIPRCTAPHVTLSPLDSGGPPSPSTLAAPHSPCSSHASRRSSAHSARRGRRGGAPPGTDESWVAQESAAASVVRCGEEEKMVNSQMPWYEHPNTNRYSLAPYDSI